MLRRHRNGRWGLVVVFALLGIFAFPQCVLANAGTPLMWATMLHLVFGNALIGLGEGLLLALVFSVPKLKSILVMILANYASAWLGALLIDSKIIQNIPIDLNNGWMWFWGMVVATYLLTLIIEWPFVAWCLRGENWLKRSVWASLLIQTASYVLLFGWYWLASGTSLYTQMNIVAPSEMSLPESVLVYYISSEDGSVYKRHLTGETKERVFELHSSSDYDRLFHRPSKSNGNHWDLAARLETTDDNNPQIVDVLRNLSVEVPTARDTRRTPKYDGTWFDLGYSPQLGDAKTSSWEFRHGWDFGMSATNAKTGEWVYFSYETPFLRWYSRNAIHLPSDKVLFQLGNDQICVFDPKTWQVALLWHGRGPVAVIEKKNADNNIPRDEKRKN